MHIPSYFLEVSLSGTKSVVSHFPDEFVATKVPSSSLHPEMQLLQVLAEMGRIHHSTVFSILVGMTTTLESGNFENMSLGTNMGTRCIEWQSFPNPIQSLPLVLFRTSSTWVFLIHSEPRSPKYGV